MRTESRAAPLCQQPERAVGLLLLLCSSLIPDKRTASGRVREKARPYQPYIRIIRVYYALSRSAPSARPFVPPSLALVRAGALCTGVEGESIFSLFHRPLVSLSLLTGYLFFQSFFLSGNESTSLLYGT